MSNIAEDIYTVLTGDTDVSALVAARIYPAVLPQGVTYPAIRYNKISTGRRYALDGYTGMDNARYQLDCFASTYSNVNALVLAVVLAMSQATLFKALNVGENDLPYDEQDSIYGKALDFSIWKQEI